MKDKGKQVIMTYAEHEGWLAREGEHKEEVRKMGELMAEQEVIMKKLIADRDDIVVIEQKRMMVQKDWKLHRSGIHGYPSYEDRYVNFPRFISGDELAESLDQGFMEMRSEILHLQIDRDEYKRKYFLEVNVKESIIRGVKKFLNALPKRFKRKHGKYFQI